MVIRIGRSGTAALESVTRESLTPEVSAMPPSLVNELQGTAPAGVRDEANHDVGHPRELIADAGLVVFAVRRFEGPVVEQRPPHNVLARHESPVTGVEGIVAVVAHHEVPARRNDEIAVVHIMLKFDGPCLRRGSGPRLRRNRWKL